MVHYSGALNLPPTLSSVADVVVLPSGDLVVVGVGNSGAGFGGIGPSDVVKVLRVNPAGGTTAPVTQFNASLNQPAVLSTVASAAVDGSGNVLLAGAGFDFQAGATIPKVLRVDANTATVTSVTTFGSAVMTNATGVTFAPVQGSIGVAGLRAVTIGTVTSSVVRVVRVSSTTGAQTVVSRFQPSVRNSGGDTLLTAVTGIAAGPVELSAAPVTSVSGPAKGIAGRARAFVFKATVGKAQRPADGVYTYQIDWDGDGTTDETLTGGRKLKVRHTFDAAGTFTVSATAIGRDGAAGFVGTRAITIAE